MTPLSESDAAAFEELAAHFQFDAGLSRPDADRLAMRFVRSPDYRRRERERREQFANQIQDFKNST